MATDKADPTTPPAHLSDLIHIDEQLAPLKALNLARPQSGWIRTIRTALRMTQAELSAILQINQKSLHALEISEAQKKIRLESLEKVADALECDLVYALVPRDTLHIHYRDRARKIITAIFDSVENSMELENKAMKFSQDYIEEQTDKLIAGDFVHWGRNID
jgi:predicted DNA-binding mobile mystery protein A